MNFGKFAAHFLLMLAFWAKPILAARRSGALNTLRRSSGGGGSGGSGRSQQYDPDPVQELRDIDRNREEIRRKKNRREQIRRERLSQSPTIQKLIAKNGRKMQSDLEEARKLFPGIEFELMEESDFYPYSENNKKNIYAFTIAKEKDGGGADNVHYYTSIWKSTEDIPYIEKQGEYFSLRKRRVFVYLIPTKYDEKASKIEATENAFRIVEKTETNEETKEEIEIRQRIMNSAKQATSTCLELGRTSFPEDEFIIYIYNQKEKDFTKTCVVDRMIQVRTKE
jgi:hypothetical protein